MQQQEFWGPDQAMEVIRTAAITAERSLSSRKALALYKLAQDDNGALRVLINQLCQVRPPTPALACPCERRVEKD
jgi:hypothetical protein